MRSWSRRALFLPLLASLLALGATAVSWSSPPPAAAVSPGDPAFKVTCYPTRIAPDDPIVFPGQPGRSHMHSFFGAPSVDADATAESLLAEPEGRCGSHYTMDRSAYWVPTLYQNGDPVFRDDGSIELRAYYVRAGAGHGEPVEQPFPQGLRIIAGDMHATTPQPKAVGYKCAGTVDTGRQRGYWDEFPSCNPDETLVIELRFPDCWNGTDLDSADHKSHMAYSSGAAAACPASHPVKLPQLQYEVWYYGVNGPAESFRLASGGPYTMHGDVISAWEPTAFAGLVHTCVMRGADCTGRMFEDVPRGDVPQELVDVQTRPLPGGDDGAPTAPTPPAEPVAPAPSPSPSEPGEHGGHEPGHEPGHGVDPAPGPEEPTPAPESPAPSPAPQEPVEEPAPAPENPASEPLPGLWAWLRALLPWWS